MYESGPKQRPHCVCTPSFFIASFLASASICDHVQLSVGSGTPAFLNMLMLYAITMASASLGSPKTSPFLDPWFGI